MLSRLINHIFHTKKGGDLHFDLSDLLLYGTFEQNRSWLKRRWRLLHPCHSNIFSLGSKPTGTNLPSREPQMLRW